MYILKCVYISITLLSKTFFIKENVFHDKKILSENSASGSDDHDETMPNVFEWKTNKPNVIKTSGLYINLFRLSQPVNCIKILNNAKDEGVKLFFCRIVISFEILGAFTTWQRYNCLYMKKFGCWSAQEMGNFNKDELYRKFGRWISYRLVVCFSAKNFRD